MLVLLPPSETKNVIRRGKPLDLDALSFPSLTATRAATLRALIEVSGAPDAPERLGVSPGLAELVRRNVHLSTAPTATVDAVYSGVLYDALAMHDLDSGSRRRARAWIVVISALFGAVRMGDRIPAYRLNMCGRLPDLPHLPVLWRQPLDEVLPAAAKRGLVVDCRSAEYASAWRPKGALAERTIVVKAFHERGGIRRSVSHNAKHTRGLVVRRIVTDAIDARRPEELVDALSPHFDLELHLPQRAGRTAELHVIDRVDAD